ncbi:hypothetical protein CSOJ01_06650 [Colletotrichum sojae]|uniref:Uncharacterized protein n=1 Tax=Colletotrichum sojae TaxID=2175907 RepID=A0A8H6JB09_9PEZI|nr:hypothetical protein CSOJ01_06650 [Colletotrichum sojae]
MSTLRGGQDVRRPIPRPHVPLGAETSMAGMPVEIGNTREGSKRTLSKTGPRASIRPPPSAAERLGVSLGVAVFLGRPVFAPRPYRAREVVSAIPGQHPGSSSLRGSPSLTMLERRQNLGATESRQAFSVTGLGGGLDLSIGLGLPFVRGNTNESGRAGGEPSSEDLEEEHEEEECGMGAETSFQTPNPVRLHPSPGPLSPPPPPRNSRVVERTLTRAARKRLLGSVLAAQSPLQPPQSPLSGVSTIMLKLIFPLLCLLLYLSSPCVRKPPGVGSVTVRFAFVSVGLTEYGIPET